MFGRLFCGEGNGTLLDSGWVSKNGEEECGCCVNVYTCVLCVEKGNVCDQNYHKVYRFSQVPLMHSRTTPTALCGCWQWLCNMLWPQSVSERDPHHIQEETLNASCGWAQPLLVFLLLQEWSDLQRDHPFRPHPQMRYLEHSQTRPQPSPAINMSWEVNTWFESLRFQGCLLHSKAVQWIHSAKLFYTMSLGENFFSHFAYTYFPSFLL